MKKVLMKKNQVVIYQAKSGAIELRGDFGKETIWATQAQVAAAFDVDVRTVNEHILNVYSTKELLEKTTLRNFRILQVASAVLSSTSIQDAVRSVHMGRS